MSEEIRINRNSENSSLGSTISNRIQSRGPNNTPWIILAVVVLLIVVGAVLFRDRLFPGNATNNNGEVAEDKLSGYQAVFLTNGQVYFGKLSDASAVYATLVDIYYLQVTQPPLQGSQEENQQQQQQPQLSLVKLGEELHGPQDEMKINREHILFYEDIKESGRVMQAIREYQANPNAGQQQSQQQPNQNQPSTQAPNNNLNTNPSGNQQR